MVESISPNVPATAVLSSLRGLAGSSGADARLLSRAVRCAPCTARRVSCTLRASAV